MAKLQTAQAIGLASGAVFGLVLWLTMRKRGRHSEAVTYTEPH